MLQSRQMKHLYLFTLEVSPLETGKTYDDLPSHLTLMSRFWSELSPDELANAVRRLFAVTAPVALIFGETIELGPKKVIAHMVSSPSEQALHIKLHELLDSIHVEQQYPQYVGDGHKAHVTRREGLEFKQTDQYSASAAYLIEVVDTKRVVRSRFELAVA
jgi:hypothetical protein